MGWPNITNKPINYFYAPDGLATQSFPTLLPFGTGDPTCSNHCCPLSLTEAFKHLMKYVTGFAKRGLIHAFNFSTLRVYNSACV